jgi:hypothetical protein
MRTKGCMQPYAAVHVFHILLMSLLLQFSSHSSWAPQTCTFVCCPHRSTCQWPLSPWHMSWAGLLWIEDWSLHLFFGGRFSGLRCCPAMHPSPLLNCSAEWTQLSSAWLHHHLLLALRLGLPICSCLVCLAATSRVLCLISCLSSPALSLWCWHLPFFKSTTRSPARLSRALALGPKSSR